MTPMYKLLLLGDDALLVSAAGTFFCMLHVDMEHGWTVQLGPAVQPDLFDSVCCAMGVHFITEVYPGETSQACIGDLSNCRADRPMQCLFTYIASHAKVLLENIPVSPVGRSAQHAVATQEAHKFSCLAIDGSTACFQRCLEQGAICQLPLCCRQSTPSIGASCMQICCLKLRCN